MLPPPPCPVVPGEPLGASSRARATSLLQHLPSALVVHQPLVRAQGGVVSSRCLLEGWWVLPAGS